MRRIDRHSLAAIADWLVVALAVSLPWSTSATSILGALWLLAVIPTIQPELLRRTLLAPAGGTPALLWLLGVLGMLWATGVPISERWQGLSAFHRLLLIPLLMMQFQRSHHGASVLRWFIASCGVLLACSWLLYFVPSLSWLQSGRGGPGIVVKDYISQAGELSFCAFVVAAFAVDAWRREQHLWAAASVAVTLCFLANVAFVARSRTGLVVAPVLLLVFAYKRLNRNAMLGAVGGAVLIGALAVAFVNPVRTNVIGVWNEVREYQPEGPSTRAGERLEFWRKSVGFVAESPIFGHGTGSIRDQFRRSVAGESGMAALIAANPHNQTLAVAIQLGFVGTMVLFAMWLAHLRLFGGTGFAAWVGLVVVVENITGCLFNSHLFDFTQGWGYVIGVGVAGGIVLKGCHKTRADPAAAEPSYDRVCITGSGRST
jgi:O-antigen ligase